MAWQADRGPRHVAKSVSTLLGDLRIRDFIGLRSVSRRLVVHRLNAHIGRCSRGRHGDRAGWACDHSFVIGCTARKTLPRARMSSSALVEDCRVAVDVFRWSKGTISAIMWNGVIRFPRSACTVHVGVELESTGKWASPPGVRGRGGEGGPRRRQRARGVPARVPARWRDDALLEALDDAALCATGRSVGRARGSRALPTTRAGGGGLPADAAHVRPIQTGPRGRAPATSSLRPVARSAPRSQD